MWRFCENDSGDSPETLRKLCVSTKLCSGTRHFVRPIATFHLKKYLYALKNLEVFLSTFPEAAIWSVLWRKLFLKISQYWQENTCVRVSLLKRKSIFGEHLRTTAFPVLFDDIFAWTLQKVWFNVDLRLGGNYATLF